MNEIQAKILANIKTGKENAISRHQLVLLCRESDRKIRDEIAEMRLYGTPIVSNTDAGGYYLPATPEEAYEYINSMESRAKRTFESIKATKEWLRKNGQMRLDL